MIIYHDSCMDGSAAALIALEALPGYELFPAQYGDPPPDVTGRDVVMVDFSYKRPEMERLIETAASLLCLDHHKTAEEELADLPGCVFDMNRSGAMMAWDYFEKSPPPWWVKYIQDRDLWMWRLPQSREINASLRSFGLHPDAIVTAIDTPQERHATDGQAILRAQDRTIEQHVDRAEMVEMFGYTVPVVNATVLFSEIVGRLAEGQPFAASFFVKANGDRVFQLRSAPYGVDVGALAKSVGGGGHTHSAGCTLERK